MSALWSRPHILVILAKKIEYEKVTNSFSLINLVNVLTDTKRVPVVRKIRLDNGRR